MAEFLPDPELHLGLLYCPDGARVALTDRLLGNEWTETATAASGPTDTRHVAQELRHFKRPILRPGHADQRRAQLHPAR